MTLSPDRSRTSESLGLLTDLYQLTMACGYWNAGLAQREAVFHLFFRQAPFGGGFALACGLRQALEWLADLRWTDGDLTYLASLRGSRGEPLFPEAFLDHLASLRFTCDVDAMPEGTVAFARQPLLRVRGPLLQAQLVETALLNMLNFQTLIATKAARICRAAQGDGVLEFGLRRAQGIDGGLAASRAAYLGGCAATSNVLAGKIWGIPVRGTHAHSWVMAFGSEEEAFQTFAESMPDNCVFVVDTYDSLEGVRTATRVGRRLRERGHELLGVRLDSGDLASLSRDARAILDEEGFPEARIYASNDLDEDSIAELKAAGAAISVWGVGTRLVTAYDQPALGGVYKLSALRREDGSWESKVKLSEEPRKSSLPGVLQVRRFRKGDRYVGDLIYDEELGLADPPPFGGLDGVQSADLLVPMLREGVLRAPLPDLEEGRARAAAELAQFDDPVLALDRPASYPVRLDPRLEAVRDRLISQR